ncbi:MAG TPA: hypothetical protein VGD81_03275 [Opitutaceae bacterium]
MNAKQTNVLNMSRAVSVELTALVERHALPVLRAGHERLNAKLAEIQTHIATQALPVIGVTETRDQVLAAATEATLLVAGLVLGYARAQRLDDVVVKVTVWPSTFVRTRLALRATLMQQVHDAAQSVFPQIEERGVTAEMLADLRSKIDAVNASHALPRLTIINRKVATIMLATLFRELTDLLEFDLDRLVELVRKTDPEGWLRYHTARTVIGRRGKAPVPVEPEAPDANATAVAEGAGA